MSFGKLLVYVEYSFFGGAIFVKKDFNFYTISTNLQIIVYVKDKI